MVKKILIGLAVLIIGLLVVVAMQPAEFHVTRAATITAAPPAVFDQVNDLHHWEISGRDSEQEIGVL
jgi:hypothetical protein